MADGVRGARRMPRGRWTGGRAAPEHWTGPRESLMKPQEARDMTEHELQARERELTDEIFHLRLRRATSQLANPMKLRETKRDLARVKTVLRQRRGA